MSQQDSVSPTTTAAIPLDSGDGGGGVSAPVKSRRARGAWARAFSKVQERLRGRKRVLLSTASFIALLTLFYTYVLPALWPCSDYFTLMLLLGIIEGLLLFFAAIWRAYTSKRSSRRRSSSSSSSSSSSGSFSSARRLRRSYSSDRSLNTTDDDDYSETSADRSLDGSDGAELASPNVPRHAHRPASPAPPPPQQQPPQPQAQPQSHAVDVARSGSALDLTAADDADDEDDDDLPSSAPLPTPAHAAGAHLALPPHRRKQPRRRFSSDSEAPLTEDDEDDDSAAAAAAGGGGAHKPSSLRVAFDERNDDDDDDDIDDDDDQRGLLQTSAATSLSSSADVAVASRKAAAPAKRGVWHRCVALRARSVSFNFCLSCFGVVNAILILSLVSTVLYLRDFTLPGVSGRLEVPGLRAAAFVERDRNGVLHVRADNEHDLFFAQGFVSAQDRLFQIEFQRRLGAGRLSERLGNATISIDRYFRTLGVRRAAELSLPLLTPTAREAIDAFVDGVNAFLATEPPLPIEFRLLEYLRSDIEPLTAVDVVQWSKVMAFDLSTNMDEELRRFEVSLNVSSERLAQFFPDYDVAAFPTVVEAADLRDDLLAAHVAQVRAAALEQRQRMQPTRRRSQDGAWRGAAAAAAAAERRFVAARIEETNEEVAAPDVPLLRGLLERFAGWRQGARASNNWVVHGQHTRSGRPLLSNDPHLAFSTPAIWLLLRLQCPTISAIGAAFPSSPGVILGRNDYIAWGVTNMGTDVQDMYVLDTINQTAYMHNGAPRAFTLRNETILVKRPLVLQEPYEIKLVVRESVHGPVLSDHVTIKGANARDLALRWAALDAVDSSINAFSGIMRAQNWTAFRAAVGLLVTPASNFVYADVQGNIGYQASGTVPVRVAGHDGRAPVSGNGSFDWLGFAPFATLPSVLNPASGYVVSANNRVAPASADASLLLNNGDWGAGYRARRISEMLRQRRRLSVDDMKAMQMDLASGLFDDLAPLIAGLLQTNLLSDRERQWLTTLSKWDGILDVESREGTVFLTWIEQLLDSAHEELGAGNRPSILFVHYTFGRFVDGELPFDPICLADLPAPQRTTHASRAPPSTKARNDTGTSTTTAPPPSTEAPLVFNDACVQFAARAFGRALDQLFDNWRDVVALGKRQQVVFEHQVLKDTQVGCFYERRSDVGGSPWTVNPSGGVLRGHAGSVRKANFGASYRQIVDFGDFSQSVFVSTMGQGEQPMSPFFDSFMGKWLAGEYVPMMQQGVYSSLQLVPRD